MFPQHETITIYIFTIQYENYPFIYYSVIGDPFTYLTYVLILHQIMLNYTKAIAEYVLVIKKLHDHELVEI